MLATNWDLPGVDIISRAERWADESWKWIDSGYYNRYLNQTKNYEAWLQYGWADRDGVFAARKLREDRNRAREEFLIGNYAREIMTDNRVEFEEWRELLWPWEYVRDKTKIVVHHTAWSQVYDTEQAALSGVRDIYEFHTLKRWWWDVWYNFLIDPYGNIYEWRAGGKDVVAAHTQWNNTKTVWIALMWNFDLAPPTPQARQSLVRLTTALAWEYNIDPYRKWPYFTAIEEEPFIVSHEHESIVWHRDAKNTACPWQYVYERLPQLRSQVASYVNYFRSMWDLDRSSLDFLETEQAAYFDDVRWRIQVQVDHGGKITCDSLSKEIAVEECNRLDDDLVEIYLAHDWYPASWWKQIALRVWSTNYIVDAQLVWQKDLDVLLSERKADYASTFWLPTAPPYEKILRKINRNELEDLMEKDVRVLLYEMTASYDNWDMRCENGCDVIMDDETVRNAKIVNVVEDKANDTLNVFIDLKKHTSDEVRIENKSLILMTNLDRSYAWYSMNTFKGDMIIKKWDYRHLDLGWIERYILINEVAFDDYLEWMWEISEQQHIEKLKTMALLIKNYTLFYIDGSNGHKSIPEDGEYNAIDDPRIFQKYLGAWFAAYGKKWLTALDATKDEIIIYDGYLPILPYFHCTAWFTKSARQYFGWTDTPWLQSVVDVAECETEHFQWHGVWLSGDGAEKMAQNGTSYKEILKWYYLWIEIEDIK